jgi:hypothetical protein
MAERKLLVSDQKYWRHPVRPRNFEDYAAMLPGGCGAWRIQQCNKDGIVVVEQWIKNKLLNAALKAIFAATAGNPFKYIAITNGAGVTALTTALTNGQSGITSLAVNALPATIASGTTLIIGAGTGQTQSVTTSAQANSGATSISVNSFTANAAYAIGSNVAPQPTANDNPSSLPGSLASYSAALSGGAFTYSNNMAATYTFDRAGSPAASDGTYTEAYMVNTSPVAATYQVGIHITFNAPVSINSGAATLPVTITETIS